MDEGVEAGGRREKLRPGSGDPGRCGVLCGFGSGGGIRTPDLRVMSPTSYHCSTPRYVRAGEPVHLED
jgi:hypothetical protein